MCFMAPAYASEPKSMLAKMLVEAAGADTLPVERAEGIYFYDYDGKKYADMASLALAILILSLLLCSSLWEKAWFGQELLIV